MTGSIVTRTLKSGAKSYAAVWRAGGKQRWKWFRKKKAAERHLTTVVKQVQEGTWTEVKPLLMGEVIDRWLRLHVDVRVQEASLARRTARLYRHTIGKHIRPTFADVRSDHLSPAHVAEWRAAQATLMGAGKASADVVNQRLRLLRTIITWARHPAQHYLAHDPLVGQKRVRASREREHVTCLEPAELAALLGAAPPPHDTLLRVVAYSGLRRGEVFGLQWADIDWGTGEAGGRLHVRRNLTADGLGPPKTRGSRRVVDVPQGLLDELNVYRAMYPPLGDGFVFRDAEGTPLDPDRWHKRVLPSIVRAVGLQVHRMGLHVLRHTYASLLIKANQHPKYISKQLGHATIAMTMDTYGHIFDALSAPAMQQLGQIMAPPKEAPALTTANGPSRTTRGQAVPPRAGKGV